MISENSLTSVLMVLLIFGAIYFVALGIYELKKWITKRKHEKEDE
jgi:hypothetical protein